MGMVINTNISSLTAQRHLAESRADMEQAMERLSSGLRINSAMDDAAGLTIAHSLDSKIASLSQAVRNANDGIALVQLAEGALDEVSAMLTRMKELATQSLNGTYSTNDLVNLNKEYQALSSEITRISENTFFNGLKVLNSTDTYSFQVGDTSSDQIAVTMEKMGAGYLGNTATHTDVAAGTMNADGSTDLTLAAGMVEAANKAFRLRINDTTFTDTTVAGMIAQVDGRYGSGTLTDTGNGVFKLEADNLAASTVVDLDSVMVNGTSGLLSSSSIATAEKAAWSLSNVDNAIASIDSFRAKLGATANRMDHAANNLMSRVEHQSAARSRIQDADYAVESANLAKAQVLQQAGTAMLAQANASTQNILSLLK